MLEKLFEKSSQILKLQNYIYKRYFYYTIDFNDKMIGILGSRGVGKTTVIIQYLNSLELSKSKKLYFSADSIIASSLSLYDIADEFCKSGGEVLAIDEIHKYKDFEKELKEIYDFLDLKVIFSGSSALQLEHKKADLSRRAVLYRVKGLSFREFLELKLDRKFESYTLDSILENHIDIADNIISKIKPFEYFKEYLQYGYFPYYFENPQTYSLKLEETVNTVIESDLPIIFNIEPQNIQKLKQLVSLICTSKPYELNITSLSKKIGINRNTLYQYIYYLNMENIFMSLKAKAKGDTIFSKPQKLYLNNPNLSFSYCQSNEIGTLREQFFLNMLSQNHTVLYPKIGDFIVNEKYTFEIGGKNKSYEQIKNIENSFVVADDIEIGFKNKIPLWLFGFLY
ncbi:ATP-binding protein [Sulfurimonas sp. SAG-AH-194-L11]|nr:AAA family ATPase [Sulfurimonas sp. SAG-AH-194-L11]MDF1877583.1 ATP-binding protein [Sulfurimonas sp. SAG-AH-194-L11]